jgi:amino acid permease
VWVFENATLFAVSTLFLILGSQNLADIWGEKDVLSQKMWVVVTGLLVSLPVFVFRTIGELKIISFLGVAAVGAVVAAVVVQAMITDSAGSLPDTHTDVLLPKGLLSAFSAMSLAFAAHAGLPTIEASMKEPKKFTRSFNLAYLVVMLLYLPVAVFGYAIFGSAVESPILKSLPENWVRRASTATITLHVLLTYPILMTLMLTELEGFIGLQPKVFAYLPKRSALRGVLVFMTMGVAMFVPYFSIMMDLIGAVCVIMTVFIMPTLFYLKLRARTTLQRILPVMVCAVGMVGACAGAAQATISLVHKISSTSTN